MGKYTPDDVKSGGKWFKTKTLDKGPVKFRAMQFPYTVGYECWADDKTVLRAATLAELESLKPANGWRVQNGKEDKPKFFVAGVFWNYNEKCLQGAVFTQAGVCQGLEQYENNADWGDPLGYDFTVSRKMKDNGFYEYSVQPSPHKPVPAEAKKAWDELQESWTGMNALLNGGDPFAPFDEAKTTVDGDIPF